MSTAAESRALESSDTVTAIMARAAVDRVFRARLLGDPQGALEAALGRSLPKDFRIAFIEKDPAVGALIVLPDLMPENGELTPEEIGALWPDDCGIEPLTNGPCWDTCAR